MNTIKSKACGSGAIAIHGLGLLGAMLRAGGGALPALVLADVEAPGLPDGSSAVLYRLAYADARHLHPYSHARWSQPPAQLLQQQLREQIGRRRAVLKADDGAAQSRGATRS